MDKIIYASATELAQAIRNGDISSREVIDAYLQRIEEVNPKINAVVQLVSKEARAQAKEADAALKKGEIKGPLHGIPMTVKDMVETAGVICTAGTKGRAAFIPTQDATVVARLRNAGAILLGKTNMPELGLAFETDNLVYGRTNNPYNLSHIPGGSSGGEAAIIAAGGSPFGVSTDAGGSIRQPADCCGIVGIKPTQGRVPATGRWPLSWLGLLTATAGPNARYVDDLGLILPIIAGPDWQDPTTVSMPLGDPDEIDIKNLRAAVYTDNGIVTPTPEIIDAVHKAVKALTDADMEVEEDYPEVINQTYEILMGLYTADGGVGLKATLDMAGTTEMHPFMQELLGICKENAVTTAEFSALMMRWADFRSSMHSFMQKYDVIISPVSAFPAPKHGESLEKFPGFSYTMSYNLTGWPGAVVRVGTSSEGVPIGVQIVARPWREDVALAVAKYIEQKFGGWQPPPI
ncbi:MAG: amidase [Candidatus Thorarchaeota archaeon]|jgi:amidase